MNDLYDLKTELYRFKPMSCRTANIALQEAKFLRWLFLAERSNTEIIKTFGMGMAYHLLKLGYVENPLGERDNTNTNLWKLSEDCVNVLKKASGRTSDETLATRKLQATHPPLPESSTGVKP